ncbi:MAG: thiamine diphosphokinase [Dehalococcoidia bacterium]
MKVVVGLGGEMQDTALLRDRVAGADLIIGADSGAARLVACGIRPNLVTGDFDSLDPALLAELQMAGTDSVPHPDPENITDAEAALRLAAERGADEVVLLGTHGAERLDHSFGSMLLTVNAAYSSLRITIIDGWTEAVGLRGDGRRSVRFEGETGDYVSLVALTERVTGVRTEGLRWPLRDGELRLGTTQGVSNELAGREGGFEIKGGAALATHHFRQQRLA